jgi:hypothetical protein
MLLDTAFLVAGLFPYLQVVFYDSPHLLYTTADTKQYPNNTNPTNSSSPLENAESPPFYPSPWMEGTGDWAVSTKLGLTCYGC